MTSFRNAKSFAFKVCLVSALVVAGAAPSWAQKDAGGSPSQGKPAPSRPGQPRADQPANFRQLSPEALETEARMKRRDAAGRRATGGVCVGC